MKSIKRIKERKRKTMYYSQKCFPTHELLDRLDKDIDSIDNELTRRILQIIMISGFRFGEVVNSYMYYDGLNKEKIIIRAVVEKKRKVTQDEITKKYTKSPLHKMFKRGFLGDKYLNYILKENVWKSNYIRNDFNLDVGWLIDNMSPSIYEPVYLFKGVQYHNAYRLLKKNMHEMEVYFFQNRNLEVPVKVMAKPSFHFYRKAFSARLIDTLGDVFSVVNYMKWDNMNQALFYNKLYKERDFTSATNLFYNNVKKEEW